MDPADGVRYALPAVLGVAFAAAQGYEAIASFWRRPALTWIFTALVLAAAAVYAWPVLRVRSTTPSPPAQAVAWIHQHLTPKAMFLVEPEMEAHAAYLLQGYDLAPIDEGLRRAARRPRAPLYLFSEGESGWPGAVTFRWPDTDAYRRLTRNHYRVVSLSPIPTGQRFEIVRGIYRWEPTAREARWRWMNDDAALRIFSRGCTRAVTVKLALDPSFPLSSNTVTVTVNGTPAATVEIARGTERKVELLLSSGGPTEIGFRSARSFVPAEAAAAIRAAWPCSSLPWSGSPAKLERPMSQEQPSVSLVIPMFNEEENIEHAIDCAVAALERHAGDYEIVVVNDASTDRSAEIVARLAQANPRIRLLRHEVNRKLGAHAQDGLRRGAQGPRGLHGRRPAVRSAR